MKKKLFFDDYTAPMMECYWMVAEDCIASSANTNESLDDGGDFTPEAGIEEWGNHGDIIYW